MVWLGRLVVMGLAWHTVLLQAAYLLYALVVICFMVCLFGLDLRKHLLRLAPFFALLLLASFVTIRSGQEDVYPLLIAALMTIGYSVLAILFAWRQPNAERIALAGAMSVTVVAALIDLWTLRSSETALGRLEWTPIAALVYALVFGAILAGRYVKSIDHFRELTQHLESRVAEREAKIETIYLREQTLVKRGAAEAAVREERGRIMRDMHDGLGAKLVTMLNTLQNGHTTQADLSAQVRESLDELRLTIDSLEDSEGDLTSVLGHLRFRLDKRFTEAGIRFDWRVAPLPALSILTPANVQHVQRLLLEVFTNILKHAKATCVTVSTEEAADGVTISIADDGVGFNVDDSTQQHGRGMTNMHFRANALGGTVKIQSPCASSGTGTEVRLWLPLFAE